MLISEITSCIILQQNLLYGELMHMSRVAR